MHIPTHKLLRSVTINSHPHSNTSAPPTPTPTSAHGKLNPKDKLNISDKRNIKVGIVALRQISKWTDKAALTLEKLEGQQDSKHCQDRQLRMEEGKTKHEMEKEREWKDTVVYHADQEVGVTRGLEMPKETGAYQEQVYDNRVYGTHNLRVLEDPVPFSNLEAHLNRGQTVTFEDIKVAHPEAYQPHKLPGFVAEVDEEEEESSGDEADDEKDRDHSESEDEQEDGDGEDTSDEEDSEVSSDEEDEDDSSEDEDSEIEDSEAEAEKHEARVKVAGALRK